MTFFGYRFGTAIGWFNCKTDKPPKGKWVVVRRPGVCVFSATPCYGMHDPWWVPRIPDERDGTHMETEPIAMRDDDDWFPVYRGE